jgi:SAM-dependent methyltransferase
MKPAEKNALIRLYEDRFARMGYDMRTIGWAGRADQALRFEVLCDVADLTGKRVCDVGCGFGDMYGYLASRFGRVTYTGFDLAPSLIEKAHELYPGVDFRVRDILDERLTERFDYFLLSGALNHPVADNMKLTRDMLALMFAQADEGVAVNFLSSRDGEPSPSFCHEPTDVLSVARSLTRWVTIRHDYALSEFTLFLYKNPRGAIVPPASPGNS